MIKIVDKIVTVILIAFVALAILGLGIHEIWYFFSDSKYEDKLIEYISDNAPVHSTYVLGDDENFVIAYPLVASEYEVESIVETYNEYVSSHIDQYNKRFESITIKFYASEDVDYDTPVATAVGTSGHMTIEDIDYDINFLHRR